MPVPALSPTTSKRTRSPETPQSTYVFVDTSGSTGYGENAQYYWCYVHKILSVYDNQPKVHYFEWNSRLNAVKTRRDLHTKNAGTDVVNVARHIATNKEKFVDALVLLITDGEVPANQMSQVGELIADMDLLTTCYLINSSKRAVNMSVPMHFTRKVGSKVLLRTKEQVSQVFENSTDYDDYTDEKIAQIKLEDSERVFESLRGFVLAKNLGRSGNTRLRDIVLKVKRRLSDLATADINVDKSTLMHSLQEKNFTEVVNQITLLIKQYYQMDRSEHEKKFQQLLNWCGNTVGMTSLDAVNFKTSAAPSTEEVSVIEPAEEETGIECPITMDDMGQGCLPLLALDQHIYSELPNNRVSDVLTMPLNMLHVNEEMVSLLVSSVGRPVGETAAIQMRGDSDPFTRRTVLGYIPLGKTPNAIAVGNTTLNRFFSVNGKQPGNYTLILSALYLAVKRNKAEWMEDSTVEMLREHLKYRFTVCESFMSLSGLTDFLRLRAPMIVCLYYVTNFHNFLGIMQEAKNIFSFFSSQEGIMEDMFELAVDMGLEIGEESWRLLRWNQLHSSMRREVDKDVPLLIRALFRGSIMIQNRGENAELPPLVITDASASEEQQKQVRELLPPQMREYDRDTLLAVFNQHRKVILSIGDCTRWPQYVNYAQRRKTIQICPRTMRPYYNVGDGSQEKTWMDSYKEIWGDSGEMFSGCNLMMQYVVRHERLPTKDEFIVFVFISDGNKYRARHSDEKTLGVKHAGGEVPRHIGIMYDALIGPFEESLKIVGSVQEAIECFNSSAPIAIRCMAEAKKGK